MPLFVNVKPDLFMLPIPIQKEVNSFYVKLQIFAPKGLI